MQRDCLRSQPISRSTSRMAGPSRDRALWLSKNVLPHEPAVRAYLSTRRVAGLEIDDVIQETYAKLASIESVENIRNPRSYFFQTAYSILVTHVRRSRIVPISAVGELEQLQLPSDQPLPDRELEAHDQLREIARAMTALPRKCREVFMLRRVHGLSQREVAEKLQLSENTVEHYMTKSIRLLMDGFGRGGIHRARSSVGIKNQSISFEDDPPANKQRDR